MTAPQVKPKVIKDDIKEQFYGKVNFVGTNNIDHSIVSQEPQKFEEVQRQAYIKDSDQVSEKIEHPLDPIVRSLPENSIGSSKIKSIVPVVSQEDQVVAIPHIDFIFRDQQ